jgi:hypothetical protein
MIVLEDGETSGTVHGGVPGKIFVFIRIKIPCQYYPDKYLQLAKALKSQPDLRPPGRHVGRAQGVPLC